MLLLIEWRQALTRITAYSVGLRGLAAATSEPCGRGVVAQRAASGRAESVVLVPAGAGARCRYLAVVASAQQRAAVVRAQECPCAALGNAPSLSGSRELRGAEVVELGFLAQWLRALVCPARRRTAYARDGRAKEALATYQ